MVLEDFTFDVFISNKDYFNRSKLNCHRWTSQSWIEDTMTNNHQRIEIMPNSQLLFSDKNSTLFLKLMYHHSSSESTNNCFLGVGRFFGMSSSSLSDALDSSLLSSNESAFDLYFFFFAGWNRSSAS